MSVKKKACRNKLGIVTLKDIKGVSYASLLNLEAIPPLSFILSPAFFFFSFFCELRYLSTLRLSILYIFPKL